MVERVAQAQHGCVPDLDDIARLYAENALRVRRLVHLDVTAPADVVEDACQVAWMRLVVNRARVGSAGAVRWVVRVARHEAMRALSRGVHELGLDALDQEEEPERLPPPPLMDELAEARDRIASIGSLPRRQQRLVWMQGLGFSYAEMAGHTGDTRRTVERQLLRAKQTLAREDAA